MRVRAFQTIAASIVGGNIGAFVTAKHAHAHHRKPKRSVQSIVQLMFNFEN